MTGRRMTLYRAEQETGLRARTADIVVLSRMIDDTYPAGLDPEAHRWRRCMKVAEEAGEVTEALLGLVGENPRKGFTHNLGQVRKELLDVALAALGAVAHLDGNQGDPLADLESHARNVTSRLRAALAESQPEKIEENVVFQEADGYPSRFTAPDPVGVVTWVGPSAPPCDDDHVIAGEKWVRKEAGQ